MLKATHEKFVRQVKELACRPMSKKRRRVETIALYSRYIETMKAEFAVMPPAIAAAQPWRVRAIELSEQMLNAMKRNDVAEMDRLDALFKSEGGISFLLS